MRFKNIAVTILIAVAFMSIAVLARSSQLVPRTQQWEYMRVAGNTDTELNRLGAQGWELASTATYESGSVVFFFKRPKN